jgi:hypothetical protein
VPDFNRARCVKAIGIGGSGGICARYAATYLAAGGKKSRLSLIDGDEYAPENAARQWFRECGNKAAVTREELLEVLGDSTLTLTAIESYVTEQNHARLLQEGDIVLLAVDNHATRKLVSDACSRLKDVVLISGGNDAVGPDSRGQLHRGTFGNVQIAHRAGGVDLTPPLTAFHREIEEPADRRPDEVSCAEALESTPQILFANLAVASAMLNALHLVVCDALDYPEACFDIAEASMRPVALPWPKACG